MSFDVIFITDTSSSDIGWQRGYGAHRLANHLRLYNYKCLVIDFSSAMDLKTWHQICELAITDKTKILAISTTWLPFKVPYKAEKFSAKTEENFTSSFFHGNYDVWLETAKKYNKDLKVVVGGPKIDCYDDIPADHFMKGLGETQFIDLLQSNEPMPKLIEHDTKCLKDSWDWKESFTAYTDYDFIKPNEAMTLETSRGCRFRCSFCSYPLIGQKNMMDFMKYQDVLYQELMSNYEKYKIDTYWVADDTFNDSTDKLEYLLEVTRNLPFKLNLRAYVRADVVAVNPQQIDMLKELGLRYAWIGIDSFHPEAAKMIGKGMAKEKRMDIMMRMRESWGDDVEIAASYIVGLPHEDSKYVRDVAYEWLIKDDSPIDSIRFMPLELMPKNILPNMNRSLIDLNYEKWGYSFGERLGVWEKNDETDIKTYLQAKEIAEKLTKDFYDNRTERNLNPIFYNPVRDPIEEYFNPLIYKLKKDKKVLDNSVPI